MLKYCLSKLPKSQ